MQWGDQDALGHVNNIVYFRWFESARIEYLQRIGVNVTGLDGSAGVVLAAIHCDFRRPLTYPDTLDIGARVTRIGRSSMTMEHAIYSGAQQAVVAEGSSTLVIFDHASGKPQRVETDFRRSIERLEGKSF